MGYEIEEFLLIIGSLMGYKGIIILFSQMSYIIAR